MSAALGVVPASQWADLVTTALLGLDRRPLESWASGTPSDTAPDSTADPVKELLDLAAAHRVAALAASPLPQCPAPEQATGVRLLPAPVGARELLAGLLARPEPPLVNAWLGGCVAAGRGVPVEHWARMADLVARSTAYDRGLLRQSLGPRGRWFLQQNPRWARLAESGAPAGPAAPGAQGAPGAPIPATVERWQETLSLVARGHFGEQTQQIAQSLAVVVPLSAGRAVLDRLDLIDVTPPEPQPYVSPPAVRRAVDRALGLIRRTVSIRLEIDQAFRDDSGQGSTPATKASP